MPADIWVIPHPLLLINLKLKKLNFSETEAAGNFKGDRMCIIRLIRAYIKV